MGEISDQGRRLPGEDIKKLFEHKQSGEMSHLVYLCRRVIAICCCLPLEPEEVTVDFVMSNRLINEINDWFIHPPGKQTCVILLLRYE